VPSKRKLEESKRWGVVVLTTPDGKYYWEKSFNQITYLSNGNTRKPGVNGERDKFLMPKHNNIEDAIRFAAMMEVEHRKQVARDKRFKTDVEWMLDGDGA